MCGGVQINFYWSICRIFVLLFPIDYARILFLNACFLFQRNQPYHKRKGADFGFRYLEIGVEGGVHGAAGDGGGVFGRVEQFYEYSLLGVYDVWLPPLYESDVADDFACDDISVAVSWRHGVS